jgi:hypothetical protein
MVWSFVRIYDGDTAHPALNNIRRSVNSTSAFVFSYTGNCRFESMLQNYLFDPRNQGANVSDEGMNCCLVSKIQYIVASLTTISVNCW